MQSTVHSPHSPRDVDPPSISYLLKREGESLCGSVTVTIVALDPVTLVTVLLFLTLDCIFHGWKRRGARNHPTQLNQLNLYSNQLTSL